MGVHKGAKRPDQQPQLEPGDNAKFLSFARSARKLNEFHPIDITDSKQVRKRIEEYFDLAAERDLKPTVAGLSGALGVDRRTFAAWCRGDYRGATHAEVAKQAKDILEDVMEQYMMNGKINPVAGIFLMSNNFGYKQKVEVTADIQTDQLEGRTPDELRARYADVIDVDAEDAERKQITNAVSFEAVTVPGNEDPDDPKVNDPAEGAERGAESAEIMSDDEIENFQKTAEGAESSGYDDF